MNLVCFKENLIIGEFINICMNGTTLVTKCARCGPCYQVGVNISLLWNSSSKSRHEFIVNYFVRVLYDRRFSIIVRKGSNDVE